MSADAMPEDSGNYTCVINGPQNAILISVTHHFNVRGQLVFMKYCFPLRKFQEIDLVVMKSKISAGFVQYTLKKHRELAYSRALHRNK